MYVVVHGLCGFNITDTGLSPMPGPRNYGCLSCNYMLSSSLSLFQFGYRSYKLVSKLHKNIFGLSLKSFKRCNNDVDLPLLATEQSC
jgi:hypothetical protein